MFDDFDERIISAPLMSAPSFSLFVSASRTLFSVNRTVFMVGSDGTSNMASANKRSIIVRKPRAPVPRAGRPAGNFVGAARSDLELDVVRAKRRAYCLVSAFSVSVSTRLRSFSRKVLRGAAIGKRPTNSGIKP